MYTSKIGIKLYFAVLTSKNNWYYLYIALHITVPNFLQISTQLPFFATKIYNIASVCILWHV